MTARLRVKVVDAVRSDGLRLVHQGRKGYFPPSQVAGGDATFDVELVIKDGAWSGPSVHKYGDKRPFVYFTWLDGEDRIQARIKLYQSQVPQGVQDVVLQGQRQGGCPACSTAVLRA